MRWLDELQAQWSDAFFGGAYFRAPRGYEVIKLPNEAVSSIDRHGYVDHGRHSGGNNYLVGRGGRWVSSLTPETPPTVINLPNGNRMWEHPGYIISTVGVDPQTGNLSHCHGGGCQYRAFSNAADIQPGYTDTGLQYINIAEQVEELETTPELSKMSKRERVDVMENFTEVPYEIVSEMAEANDWVEEPGRYTLGEALKLADRGVIYAWTGEDIGTHLVAMRNGKQVVTDPSQLLKPMGDYSEGAMGRDPEHILSEANWTDLYAAAELAGKDLDPYVEGLLKKGKNPYLLPLDIRAVYLPGKFQSTRP